MELDESQKRATKHKEQRDSARAERDSALEERDNARDERDDLQGQADSHVQNNAAQEGFLAAISHDLRNPIAAIKMAIEIIREAAVHEKMREMVDLIDRNADQAGELINQLLDAHLIKSGAKLAIEVKQCHLLPILRKCQQALAPQFQNKVILDSKKIEGLWGHWDPAALERAFKNLLSNALKFSEADKPIQITASQGPDITAICFHNYGEVISLENQLRIFENHFRVHNNDIKSKKGWGLGLTLIRGIAEAHNGKVEVSSDRIDGTLFTLKLPNDAR